MNHIKRETFDEYRSGGWVLQLFEPRLWRLGVKFHRITETVATDKALISVETGWVLALPMLSVSRRHLR
jgi:hypothetical protein